MKFHDIFLCESLILIAVSYRKWEKQWYCDGNGQLLQILVFVEYHLALVIRLYNFVMCNLKFKDIDSEKAA